jgi:hypothetical protein
MEFCEIIVAMPDLNLSTEVIHLGGYYSREEYFIPSCNSMYSSSADQFCFRRSESIPKVGSGHESALKPASGLVDFHALE